jgi:cell division protein FtsI/penicillin-binding protein 2
MSHRSSIMGRMFVLLGLLLLLPAAIFVQIIRVNLVEGDGFRELWSSQAIDYISIPAQRGHIYDSRGSLLATNTVIYRVAIDPHTIVNTSGLQDILNILSRHTGRPLQFYRNRLQQAPSQSKYVVLERSVPVQIFEDLNELNIRGLILEEEYRRSYSFGTLASHVIGYVNHNLDGMTGLESRYNNVLNGIDGQQQVRKDRLNQIFAYVGAPRKLPVQGHSLHTTIDSQIQAIVEEELEAGVARHMAVQGTAIVMDPKTGAVKAIANYPTFDPNNPAASDNENRRNFAVSDMIEPGSTFKLVPAIAAVEQRVVSLDESFDTPASGQKSIYGQLMRDHDPLGTLTFSEVIAKSSNIATAEIAMRLKPDTFYQYARNMGFGALTQIDLPNEESGRLQRPFEWSLVTLPWMSIGYEIHVTPIQLIQSYAAFANGGTMMKPYVVEKITDETGNIIHEQKPVPIRRIAKKETIDKLIPVFEQAVSDSGTARWAMVDGLRIAGKTGTAQKFLDGRYQPRYRASFLGFFPVEDPEIIILVLLDEPKTSIYGGYTSGSIFKEMATRISGLSNHIQRYNEETDSETLANRIVTPDLTGFQRNRAIALLKNSGIPYNMEGSGTYVTAQYPVPGEEISRNTPLKVEFGLHTQQDVPEGYIRVPDLTNMNMRQAVYRLISLGLEIETIGSGTIYTQFPKAGELMRPGRTVTVRGKSKPISQLASIAAN